ncbi:transposase [Protaetiibacter larvae]|uniref:Transposase n=1 Tax=Protaetiibacter larvae TaxID=2592654 RepID=A0A5C1Y8F0_9MICO|nr:transposase [Protaetiibacter larvae]QEO09449.1 transposase [Protaetiibacter larvae]
MAFERKYTDEVRTRSVETVIRRRRDEPGNRAIIREVAEEFDVGPQSLRQWLARYDDGSYDYDDDDGDREVTRRIGSSRQALTERIAFLERRILVLEEDNRSLTRVVALLSEQLRPLA